jgi:hypothetical protein
MKRRRGVTVPATPLFGSIFVERFITSSDKTDTGKGAPAVSFVKKKLGPAGFGAPCLGLDEPRRKLWPPSQLADLHFRAMSMSSIITANW